MISNHQALLEPLEGAAWLPQTQQGPGLQGAVSGLALQDCGHTERRGPHYETLNLTVASPGLWSHNFFFSNSFSAEDGAVPVSLDPECRDGQLVLSPHEQDTDSARDLGSSLGFRVMLVGR